MIRRPSPSLPAGPEMDPADAAAARGLDLVAIAPATIDGFLSAVCRHLGLDFAAVKASDPKRGATANRTWRTESHARQLALYLANQLCGIPQAELARAAGLTPAAVCLALKAVEDRRDDPTFDALVHGDVLDWWQRAEGMSFADAVDRLKREAGERTTGPAAPAPRAGIDAETERKRTEARSIWEASQAIGGTLAEAYLRGCRRIAIELPDCLRFHSALRAEHDGPLWPALVAKVTDRAGNLVAIQRTFLRPDGSGKAPIERPKRALGPVGLGVVRLAPASGIVGLAEGIETGLSAMQLFRVPTWCVLGSNLGRVDLPPSIRNVALFADRGGAGEAAAAKAAERFRSERRRVAVRFSATGKDFNDDLRNPVHGC